MAFSPVFFVAGTKLMVPAASAVASYRDLAGKTVVVTAGTTNEAALRTLSDKQKLGIDFVTARDHADRWRSWSPARPMPSPPTTCCFTASSLPNRARAT